MHGFCSYNQSQMRVPENTQSDTITTLTHISNNDFTLPKSWENTLTIVGIQYNYSGFLRKQNSQ
jgi:hypothetical protein